MKFYQIDNQISDHVKTQIAELFLQQVSVTDNDDSFNNTMAAIEQALLDDSQSRIIVAEDNDAIMGLALLNIGISLRVGGLYLWLNELYVHNEHRNKGIGKNLLLHVIRWAESNDIKAIELETGVNNSVTKHMYNSLGFYEVVSKRYGFSF